MSDAQTATVYLSHPGSAELGQAFRELPRLGRVIASCHPSEIAATLKAMEDSGLVAMQVHRSQRHSSVCEISAFKAKQGPCYDTGRVARYRGAACAALDDDNHLVFRQLRVCEKTASVYRLPPYQGLIEVSDGDPELLARHEDDPVLFDCNTYEQDLRRLLGMVPDNREAATPEGRAVFYPGPLRLLILGDGTMVRRGQATVVAADQAGQLCARDGCVVVEGVDTQAPVAATSLHQAFQELGSACLLGELPLVDTHVERSEADWSVLTRVGDAVRQRLQTVISNNDRFFILTGTDPDDEHGCCPSDEVGDALTLVDAAILSCFRAPAPPDACPTTVFAFAGEIEVTDRRPSFSRNPELREKVLAALTRSA
jgi:hypothetical protein